MKTKPKPTKPVTAYFIVDRKNNVLVYTGMPQRKQYIGDFCRNSGAGWRNLLAIGYRVERLTIGGTKP